MHYSELAEAWAEMTASGAAFEIVTVPVRGRNLRAYGNAPATMRDLWLATAPFADRDHLVYEGERLTYADARRIVAAAAAWMAAQGVRAGDRVAVSMRNYPSGCSSIGPAPSPASPAWA